MNDLNLRVSGGIGEKVKKPAAPITMPYWTTEMPGVTNEFFSNFFNSNSADNQLKLLQKYLNSHKNECEQQTIQFLVLLFWHADAKHPVKGFLKKHITDSRTLRQPFTEALSSVITTEIQDSSLPYAQYVGTVTRLDACMDKFPPGAAAVSSLEIAVALYLVSCLESCIKTVGVTDENILGNGLKSEPLAPTEINKIYDLVHLTVRLLLYMIQKVTNENRGELSCLFGRIRSIIAQLMAGKQVPMDTKSVSGIIYVTLHLFENGPDSWIMLLEKDRSQQSGTENLVVYSGVATVVAPAQLAAAAVRLADHILAIGDQYSSDSSHMLAVARTVLTLSRSLALADGLAARLARFCWAHMEHHADSVRHLAAQAMARVVAECVRAHTAGDPTGLDDLFASLATLDGTRKSFYVTLTALAEELGAGVLARRPDVIRDVIASLHTQAVQACATTFMETLLKKHIKECDTETIYRQWVVVTLDAVKRESEPAVLGILERVLARAVQWDSGILHYILPEDRALSSYEGSDLKCVLLVLGVVRRAGVCQPVAFGELMHAACDADDEIRILSLSLAADTPRSTQALSRAELVFVLHFLDYNVNAQAPNFRQLVLARMKKILKRLEDSYKVLKRTETEHATEIGYYWEFASELRAQCFGNLAPGGNYGRRSTALQLLAWLHALQIDCHRTWTEERAEVLYNLLDDSYENNKALALDVLKTCPAELIKPLHRPGHAERVLAQARSVRPADCVAASYRLLLLLALPVHSELYAAHDVPEPKYYGLLTRILSQLKEQAARARDIARAARDAPMYGLVHCLARLIGCLDPSAIAGNSQWSVLIADVVATCELVNGRVARVVTAASPEGLLPEELAATPADSSGGARLADGRGVSAQMVLLCGWRSVKETSLLLGAIASRLAIEGEAPAWTLSCEQMEHIGEHLMELLSTVKHRGAFEQAYVGFTMLLGRLWKCSSSRLHRLPLQWFSCIERGLALPAAAPADYCATRRGAGLPFMIQALVTTELAAESSAPRGRLLTRCVELCVRVAGAGAGAGAARAASDAARAHLVLRALCRHTQPAAAHTAAAIVLAVRGFDADTWTERNSATLLFSALTVRVFGVLRARSERLCVRNRMTGRIFFLRYPQLYDFLLDQLKSASAESTLRPSLFPTLLLLGRLYPSALEGTVSNLKLERFLPLVVRLGGARDAHTRRLAARAAAPLVAPHRFVAHILSLLTALGDPAIKRNLCHGLLCQLGVLLELNPELDVGEESRGELLAAIRGTFWIAAQARATPCFVVADEWLKLLNLILLRFPTLLDDDLPSISTDLESALLAPPPIINTGRETFLAKLVYMLLIITNARDRTVNLVTQCLRHADYEVNLSMLNYLLLLHGHNDDSCAFLEHLAKISQKDVIEEIEKDENYVKLLCDVSRNGYLECKQKALRVLAFTNDTQREIVKLKLGNVELTEEDLVAELIDSIRNGHQSLCSIYLDSLLRLVGKAGVSLEVGRVLRECSTAGNEEGTRGAVVGFLEENLGMLLTATPSEDPADMFEWSATLWAATAMLLEDDAPALRQRVADAVLRAVPDTDGSQPRRSLAAVAAQRWRRAATHQRHAAALLLLLLAALDFCAHVDSGDELGEECRVFDHNETHNTYLEEFIWSRDCAIELKRVYRQTYADTHTIDQFLQSLLSNPTYKETIQKLCIENVAECLTGRLKSSNPKIDLFLKILYE